jgi:hypothetical protein
MRRSGRWAGLLLLLAVVACGDAEQAGETAGELAREPAVAPEGWYTRADGLPHGGGELRLLADPEGFGFEATAPGLAFREQDVRAAGAFRMQAVLRLTSVQPGDVRPYGVFVGGGNLLVEDASYTAFLIRSSGEFSVQRREGGEVTTLLEWIASPVIRVPTADSQPPMNILAVEMVGEDVRFLINNEEVALLPAARVEPLGALGLRVDAGVALTVVEWTVR